MEEWFNFIKDTDEFRKYVKLVEGYSMDLPAFNAYQTGGTYKYDPAMAILEKAGIQKQENGVSIEIYNKIGRYTSGEELGYAKYMACMVRENQDIVAQGRINATFTSYNNTMFVEDGVCKAITETVMDESFQKRYSGKGYLCPSNQKTLK